MSWLTHYQVNNVVYLGGNIADNGRVDVEVHAHPRTHTHAHYAILSDIVIIIDHGNICVDTIFMILSL